MAVVDALVSEVLDLLNSNAGRETEQGVRLRVVIEQQVQSLASNLRSIQPVLIDAERRRIDEKTVKLWLDRLKSVVYDIDDVFDEWKYEFLKAQFVRRKVWCFGLLCSRICFPVVTLRFRLACKIGSLNKRLYVIAGEKDKYGFLSSEHNDEQAEQPPRIISFIGDISEVKGRAVEKAKLLNLLLESDKLQKLHPISIVGMEGVGKTTLAKLVYHDQMVETHFDKRIWVSVSKNRIARAVLETLIGGTRNPYELKLIAAKIKQSVEGKRFLLVLDDVWSEDPKEWKELEDCLIGGSSGSKILVITPKENAEKLMGCIDKNIFQVGLLSEVGSWSFFCEIAFYWWSSEGRQKLEKIGSEIVERCEGWPLAVKTIAGLLHFKESKREWESVLGSELWKLKETKPSLYVSLRLSYDDLPSSLKQCILSCTVFPKGYRMSEDELVSLWMAHGFLRPTKEREMETIGHDYFQILSMRSFFQDFEVKEGFNRLDKTYCKMHDTIHDFAKFLVGTECLCIDDNSSEDAAFSDKVYHLHVTLREKMKFLDSYSLSILPSLRSLIVLLTNEVSLTAIALYGFFSSFTYLRSLSLSGCRLENIPSNINKLIHLRWLKLSKNYALKELPETICELYHLQTLSVNWCDGLTHFPKGVEKLINLRRLKNDYTYFLLPKGIGKLSGLQKLSRVTINPKIKDAFSLRDLKNLNNIGGPLTMFFMERERDTLVEDAKQANLQEKKHITVLSLNFPKRAAEEWMQQEDEALVEALRAPPSLVMLRIACYMGGNCPSWIKTLTSLKKLKLWYWSKCEHLPALAKLPCLEYVEFNNFGSVRKVTAEFYQMEASSSSTAPLFPKLKNLQFTNMTEWEEWSDYEGDAEVMPCLSYLSFDNCPKLMALPNFIRKRATLQMQIS